MGAVTKEDFAEKNALRKRGEDRVGRRAYREARSLRQAVGGAFGQLSKQYWKAASVGTTGEGVNGGVGNTKEGTPQ